MNSAPLNSNRVQQVADAILYEGYMLYPYRPSSVKNRQRWTFGGLYSEAYAARAGGPSSFESQFLVESSGHPEIAVTVRFLHLLRRTDGFEEGTPREVGIGPFRFEGGDRQCAIAGQVELTVDRLGGDLHRATLRVRNTNDLDDPLAVLASTHAIARVANGAFVSLIDPPGQFRVEAARCTNHGVWPVMAGEPGSRDCMLISPIILYDYPQVAPESVGDLFDGTEIDEILNLRILTLTDEEKAEIRSADARTQQVLDRAESLDENHFLRLHGTLRSAPEGFKPGDRVRLRPRRSGDVMDIALAGEIAEIEAVEIDFEQRVHLAVVLENDPGKDLGTLRQPGHRFFFSPEEVEPVP
jgi:hypothetical protein